MNKLKFVYWFAYYNTKSPSVRYRGKYALEHLDAEFNIPSYFVVPGYRPKEILAFLRAYFSALLFRKTASLIVIQRVNSNFIYANLLKILVYFRKEHTVYDTDDADYLEFPPATINYFISKCSAIMTGSHELATYLSQLNTNTHINTSPVPDLNIVKSGRGKIFTVGWIGGFGGGHEKSLTSLVFPALKKINFEFKLVLAGVPPDKRENLVKNFSHCKQVILEMPEDLNWNDEVEIQRIISGFDIGIATLLNTVDQRSKSAFKLKQYMNNGVPVLSSDLPENNFFLKDGINGFLCSNTNEFYRRINEFYYMEENNYARFSANARNSVVQFDLSAYCHNLLSIYNSKNNDFYHSVILENS